MLGNSLLLLIAATVKSLKSPQGCSQRWAKGAKAAFQISAKPCIFIAALR